MIKRFLSLLLIVTVWLSCSPTEPQNNLELQLIFEDASCTEAWITIKTTLPVPAEINLRRTDAGSSSKDEKFYVSTNDTLLYIDSLLPNQTYKLQVSSIQYPVHSNEISITTLDTTSSNFTFTTWTFGGTAGSSSLYDVAIINENNIWAVGEIYVADTSENGYTMYNAVHWDGNEWELKRIMFYTFCGQQHQNAYPASSVIAFSENEIWVAQRGSQIARLNETTQIATYCIPVSVNKLWGTDSENIFAVGPIGQIGWYNGSKWTRIESGTSLHIYDIWGEQTKDGDYEILCVAADHFISPERKILSIKNNSVQEVSTSNISIGSIYGVWFKTGRKYFVVGNGIYTKGNVNNENNWTALHNGLTPYYTYAIRGTSFNNIFICGSFGESLFFNGLYWTTFRNTPGFYDVEFYQADIRQNILAAVGYNGSKGFVTIGKK